MTTHRLVNNLVKAQLKDKELLLTTLLDQPPVQTLRTQLQADHKPKHQPSVVDQPDLAPHTLQAHQATNHQLQPAAPTIQDQHQLEAQAIPAHLRQEDPLDTSLPAHPNIQALKDHIQVLELQFHLPTCHRQTTDHRNKALKASRPKLTHPTQPLAPHKRRTEITYRHDEDKSM